MISEIIKDHNMSIDYESNWIPIKYEQIPKYRKEKYANSLAISWTSVTGTIDGYIEIMASNSVTGQTYSERLNIMSISNLTDVYLYILNPVFKLIKFNYHANSILSGILNASIFYDNK